MAVAFREAGGVTTTKVLFCESLSEFLLVGWARFSARAGISANA